MKGSYKEVKGNLLSDEILKEVDIIAHGCNCHKMMGAGIALAVKHKFPLAYKADVLDERLPINRLGDYTYIYDSESNVFVVNLYSQYDGGPNLDYSALELSLRKLTMIFTPGSKVGLPLIGCGIAGGDWEQVKSIIQRVLSEYNVTIVIYDK